MFESVQEKANNDQSIPDFPAYRVCFYGPDLVLQIRNISKNVCPMQALFLVIYFSLNYDIYSYEPKSIYMHKPRLVLYVFNCAVSIYMGFISKFDVKSNVIEQQKLNNFKLRKTKLCDQMYKLAITSILD